MLSHLENLELVVVIGQYALQWHLGVKKSQAITPIVKNWRAYQKTEKHQQIDVKVIENVDNGIEKPVNYFPLPHPSPRNNIWLKKNPWFEKELLPDLQAKVATVLAK